MAITTIEFVDTDLSTVLFDLHSSTGSTNSSWGSVITKFGLGGSFRVDNPLDAERFQRLSDDGGFTTFSRRGLGTASWKQIVSGSSEANLRLGIGRISDLVTRGGILRIVTGTTTRYLRFEPSNYPKPFAGKDLELHDIYQQFAFRQGLEIELACQPYWEGAEVVSSGVTVPNDPATSTKVRVFPLNGVTGDLPTRAKVRVKIGGESRTLSLSAAADDIIDCTNHGFSIGEPVVFTSLTGGSGLTAGTTYWIVSTSFGASTFRIANSPGGAAIGFTTDITAGTVELGGMSARALVASRAKNDRAASFFDDYLSSSGFFQANATNRSWTVTLGSDTTNNAAAGTPFSAGTAASCSFSTVTTFAERIRATRTANLPSLAGEWDVYARGDFTNCKLQLLWGPSATDLPPAFSEEIISFDAASSPTCTDLKLGSIWIPESPSPGGLTLALWAEQSGGSGSFDVDFFWLSPKSRQGTMFVPTATATKTLGTNLTSPPYKLTADATWVAGTKPAGTTYLLLDATSEAGGLGPIGGTVYPQGINAITFEYDLTLFIGTYDLRVVSVLGGGSGSEVSGTSATTTLSTTRSHTVTIYFLADGVTAYQPEFTVNTRSAGNVKLRSMTHTPLTWLDHAESFRSFPTFDRIDKLDTAAALAGYLGLEGGWPTIIEPGDNQIMVRVDEVPVVGSVGYQNILARQPTVTVSYFPRFAF